MIDEIPYNPFTEKKTMKNMTKFDRTCQIINELNDIGYDVYDERDIVRIIDQYRLDPNRFAQMPYLGGYEQFKKDVLNGKYDDPIPKEQKEKDTIDYPASGRKTITV